MNKIYLLKIPINLAGAFFIFLIPDFLILNIESAGYFEEAFTAILIVKSVVYIISILIVLGTANKIIDQLHKTHQENN